MSFSIKENTPWYNSPPLLIIPHVVTGVLTLSITAIVVIPFMLESGSLASCLMAAKWMSVALACLVAVKLLKDAYSGYKEGMAKNLKHGLQKFAFEASLTILIPLVASVAALFICARIAP